MAVASNAVLRAVYTFQTANGTMLQNTYWFQTAFQAPQTELNVGAALIAWGTAVYNSFAADIKSTQVPYSITVDEVAWTSEGWSQVRQIFSGPIGSGMNFTGVTSVLPEGVCAVVTFKTRFGRHQGRKYIGGMVEGASDGNGNLEAASGTRIVTGMTKWLTPYSMSAGNTIKYVIVDTQANILYDVIGLLITRAFGYQRRRKPGRGS